MRTIQPSIKRLIEEITFDVNNDYGKELTPEEVEEVINSQFLFIKREMATFDVMDANTYNCRIRIPFIGYIQVAPSRIKHFHLAKNKLKQENGYDI